MAEEAKVEISIEASQKTGAITATAGELDKLQGSVAGAADAAKKGGEGFGSMDEASKALAGSLANLVSAAAIGQFFKSAVEESLKEAEALRTLKFAVESTGASWDTARGQIEAFASAQQASTRFDDTVTFEVLGKLQRATGDLGQAMSATALAQDIAAASGKSLADTTQIINGLLTGQERSVKMAQKEFAAYVGTADTTASVLAALEKGFIVAAVAEESHAKSLAQSQHFLDDFKQRVGDGIVPIMDVLAKSVAFVAKGYEELGVTIAGFAAGVFTAFGGLGDAIEAAFNGNFAKISDIARETKDGLVAIAEDTGQSIDDIEDRFHGQSVARVEERKALHAKASEEQIAKEEEVTKKKAALEKKLADDLKKLQKERADNFAATMQFISVLSTSKNKELQIIGKAAAIATATIDTSVAVTKALASAPPPFNFLLAGLVGAAGAAQIAKISGVPLEKGGVVDGSQDGIQATIGEKGKKEAVLPLTDSRAMRDIGSAIANAGGARGGGTVININVTAAVPEWRSIMDAIAEEAARGTPEIIRVARRLSDLAEINSGRAA